MKINSCKISKVLSSIAMIMLIMAALAGYLGHTFLLDLNTDRARQVARVQESEWIFIESILNENYDKAYDNANKIKSELLVGIDKSYGTDRATLKKDLDSLKYDADIFVLFNKVLKNRYLNGIENDRNDPFIMSSKGMFTDLSLNRAVQLTDKVSVRDWESEYKLHYNPYLMKQTITNLVERTGKPVFWQYSAPRMAELAPIPQITQMDIAELRRVYYRDGVSGLETYEFGRATYIFEHEDLFGVPDIDGAGKYTKNDKIIVVSGFSLYDVLVTKYPSNLSKYDDMLGVIELRYTYTQQAITNTLYTMLALFLISFFVLIHIQQLVISKNVSEAGDEGAYRNIP